MLPLYMALLLMCSLQWMTGRRTRTSRSYVTWRCGIACRCQGWISLRIKQCVDVLLFTHLLGTNVHMTKYTIRSNKHQNIPDHYIPMFDTPCELNLSIVPLTFLTPCFLYTIAADVRWTDGITHQWLNIPFCTECGPTTGPMAPSDVHRPPPVERAVRGRRPILHGVVFLSVFLHQDCQRRHTPLAVSIRDHPACAQQDRSFLKRHPFTIPSTPHSISRVI